MQVVKQVNTNFYLDSLSESSESSSESSSDSLSESLSESDFDSAKMQNAS